MLQYNVIVVYDGIDDRVKCDDLISAVAVVNKVVDGTATWVQPGWIEARIEVHFEGEQSRIIFRVAAPTSRNMAIFADLRQCENRLLGTAGQPVTVKIVAGGVLLFLIAIGSLSALVGALSLLFIGVSG